MHAVLTAGLVWVKCASPGLPAKGLCHIFSGAFVWMQNLEQSSPPTPDLGQEGNVSGFVFGEEHLHSFCSPLLFLTLTLRNTKMLLALKLSAFQTPNLNRR